jgi:hypothetical protein
MGTGTTYKREPLSYSAFVGHILICSCMLDFLTPNLIKRPELDSHYRTWRAGNFVLGYSESLIERLGSDKGVM